MNQEFLVKPKHYENIEKEANLLIEMSNSLEKKVDETITKKGKASVLDYGSGDLKLSSFLTGGLSPAKYKPNSVNYVCYDPMYKNEEELEKLKLSSRIIIRNHINLLITNNIQEIEEVDVLISNFCFHHFLETNNDNDFRKEITRLNPKTIIITEYNIDRLITLEEFRKIFGHNAQEKKEVISSNYDWERLKEIHTRHSSAYFIEQLEVIGYKIIKIKEKNNKFYLVAEKA